MVFGSDREKKEKEGRGQIGSDRHAQGSSLGVNLRSRKRRLAFFLNPDGAVPISALPRLGSSSGRNGAAVAEVDQARYVCWVPRNYLEYRRSQYEPG